MINNPIQYYKQTYRAFRKAWRAYGALFVVIIQWSFLFWLPIVSGIATMLMVTVPCGMKTVNENKWLWYPRQALFLIGGLLIIMS